MHEVNFYNNTKDTDSGYKQHHQPALEENSRYLQSTDDTHEKEDGLTKVPLHHG